MGNITAVPPKAAPVTEPVPAVQEQPRKAAPMTEKNEAPEPAPLPVEAPPSGEDMPPWDMEPPPSAPTAPQVREEPKPTPRPAPVPSTRPAPPKPPVQSGFWADLVGGLKGRIPMGEYSFLSNPAMVRGTTDGPLLTLWAQSDFVKNMIAKPGILAIIEKAAQTIPGAPYRVAVTVGTPPAASAQPQAAQAPEDPPGEEEHDKLDDLLALGEQFGDIITEE